MRVFNSCIRGMPTWFLALDFGNWLIWNRLRSHVNLITICKKDLIISNTRICAVVLTNSTNSSGAGTCHCSTPQHTLSVSCLRCHILLLCKSLMMRKIFFGLPIVSNSLYSDLAECFAWKFLLLIVSNQRSFFFL